MKQIIAIALMLVVSGAYAAESDNAGWRIGFGAAFSEFSTDDNLIDDSQVGFNLSGGYRFNDWLGIEGGYLNTSDFEARLPAGSSPATASIAYQGFYIAGVGYIPIPSDEIDLYLKAGFYDFNSQLTTDGGVDSSARVDGAMVGGGAILHISDQFGIKAEFDYFDVDQADLWSVILGLEYSF
jgi:hypothetical protein